MTLANQGPTDLRIIHNPTIHLVSMPTIDELEIRDFLAEEGAEQWETDSYTAAGTIIESAARLCYMSFTKPRPGGHKAFIDNILASGHGSVLEHAVYGFILTGVSRSFSHELVRHRAGFAFSQLSQRYVDESQVAFVAPPALSYAIMNAQKWKENEDIESLKMEDVAWIAAMRAGAAWIAAMREAVYAYKALTDYLFERNKHIPDSTERRKASREAARSVLPNATETKVFVTANVRSWRHFVEMRSSPKADAEMRRVAIGIYRALHQVLPSVFGDYIEDIAHGGLTTPYHKV